MMFPCLGIFLVFIGILMYAIHKSDHEQKEVLDDFLATEQQANSSRRQDLSDLTYIQVPLSRFPIGLHDAPELLALEKELQELSERKILNLNHVSNTELKLQYGVANLEFLSECDQNCAQLFVTLSNYGKALIALDDFAGATAVLEYAVGIHSDLTETYLLLADLYQRNHESRKIQQLIQCAQQLDPLHQSMLIGRLNSILHPSVL